MSDQVPGNEPPQNDPPQSVPPRQPPYEPPTSTPPTFTSNYPRGSQNNFGYLRPPGVYWDTIGASVSMILSKWGVYALATLVFFLIGIIGAIPMYVLLFGTMFAGGNFMASRPVQPSPFVFLLPQILLQIVSAYSLLCLASVGVRHAQGAEPEIGDFFLPFRVFGKSSVACLLAASPNILVIVVSAGVETILPKAGAGQILASSISLILTCVAYVGAHATLLLAGTAAVFTDMSPMDCAKKAFSTLGLNSLVFGILFIVAYLLSMLGIFACCFGVLISFPIVTNVIGLHYIYCFQNNPDTSTELRF